VTSPGRGWIGQLLILAALLYAMLSGGCRPAGGAVSTLTPEAESRLHPIFREYYRQLGGVSNLGQGISDLVSLDGYECQYTENALMCRSPQQDGLQNYFLYPLGRNFDVQDPPNTLASDGMVVNGYTIFPDFIPLYTMLGAKVVGAPLSQIRINQETGRYEQYFENMGFFQRMDEPPGTAHTLPYGTMSCKDICRAVATVIEAPSTIISPFDRAVVELGGYAFTGEPLEDPVQTTDGYLEQCFENLAISAPVDNLAHWGLRPLPIMLALQTSPPGANLYASRTDVIFYPVQGDLGYAIPRLFYDFIGQHAGLTNSGKPISDLEALSTGELRQCYENYCLEYSPQAGEDNSIQLTPLGRLYLQSKQQSQTGQVIPSQPGSSLGVRVSVTEKSAMLAPGRMQQILVTATDDQGQPLSDVQGMLVVSLPGQKNEIYNIPATGADGSAQVIFEVSSGLPNGSLITYEACLKFAGGEMVCARGSYLVWQAR
jgi:hypothetical protein